MGAWRFALPATLAGVAAGILAADAWTAPQPALAAGGVALLALGGLLGRRGSAATLLGLALAAAALGAWRSEAAMQAVEGPSSVATLVDGEEHELIGTIVDDPRPREDRLQLVLADIVTKRDGRVVRPADRLLVWLPRGVDARAGDRLRIAGELEIAEDFDGFAYRDYLARQGIGAIARARAATVIAGTPGPAQVLAGVRAALLRGLNHLVPEPEAALGAGFLLGVRASIAAEINAAFATAGLTHVVAISGWNIAIVAAIVTALLSPLRRRRGGRWATPLTAAAVVGGYVVLTGASPSVVRAALMAGAMLVGRLGGSRAHAPSALALAALAMLLVAPPVLWDVGFQLSLLATAGLVWFGAPIEARLAGWPGWIREPVALTLAAQLTTLPIILVNFERLSLVAPIANVLVVPFVPIAMLFSAIAALVGILDATIHVPALGTALTWFAGGAAWLVLRLVVVIGTAVASIPHASVPVTVPPPFAIAWFQMLALGTWALRSPSVEPASEMTRADPGVVARTAARLLRPTPILVVLVATLLAISIASRPDGRLHVTTLDIGQGDAILVETPSGATMLIDGGPDPELTLRRIGANLPFFARRIDLILLTHPHQDHVAGLVEVAGRFSIGAILHAGIAFENPSYERLLTDAHRSNVQVGLARTGGVIALDATTSVRILYPSAADASAPLPDGDINNGSVVVVLTHGGFSALLTGDAEAPVETALLARHAMPQVDLLKVAHHGSRTSTSPALLEALRPSAAVISAGADNEYGHPAPETLATLAGRPGLAVYRTDTEGDVELETDGATYRVRTDAGWSDPRPVHGQRAAGSIGGWPCPIVPPHCACSSRPGCRMGSSSTRAAWLAWPSPPRASSPRRRFRWTVLWSRRRRCSTTSTRPRAVVARTTGSPAPVSSRRWVTGSSRCRSPPTRSPRSSTRIGTRSAGPRCSSPLPTGTWRGGS
ncbi:MAG TPA: DNA internalization-related competence protein ComEC/Rec2 [Candidatus Limnocylindria bacterium]|nr:DNA internalization-related competence protein ComEC/Rec2 [Candidatus Limnocylindria bacterium]